MRLLPQHQFGPSSIALQFFILNTGINSRFRSPNSLQQLAAPRGLCSVWYWTHPNGGRGDDAPAVLGLPESSLEKPERRGHRERAAEEGEAGNGHFRGPDLGPRPYAGRAEQGVAALPFGREWSLGPSPPDSSPAAPSSQLSPARSRLKTGQGAGL